MDVKGLRRVGVPTFPIIYDPREIIANVKRLLNGQEMEAMVPSYLNFKGKIKKGDKKSTYILYGDVDIIDEQTFRIEELPIRKWTQDYKQFLESKTDGSPNVHDPLIKDFKHNGDDATIDIVIKMMDHNKITTMDEEDLLKKFKLRKTISTSNMHLFDEEGKIKKFESPEEIIEEFYSVRYEAYKKRMKKILENRKLLLWILKNKSIFIERVVKGDIHIFNENYGDLLNELKQAGITAMPRRGKSAEPLVAVANDDNSEDIKEEQEADPQKKAIWRDYGYLLSLPIGIYNMNSVQKLNDEYAAKTLEMQVLEQTTVEEQWTKELDLLLKKLDEMDRKEVEADKSSGEELSSGSSANNSRELESEGTGGIITRD